MQNQNVWILILLLCLQTVGSGAVMSHIEPWFPHLCPWVVNTVQADRYHKRSLAIRVSTFMWSVSPALPESSYLNTGNKFKFSHTTQAKHIHLHLVCLACGLSIGSLMFCDPMDCSLPGSSVQGIFQTRVLESYMTQQFHIWVFI